MQPEVTPPLVSADAPTIPETPPVASDPTTARPCTRRLWVAAALAGILAGVVSAGLGEFLFTAVKPPTSTEMVNGLAQQVVSLPDQIATNRKKAAVTFGAMAAVLALAMGSAGAWTRRSMAAGLKPALIGLAVGAVATALLSYGLAPMYYSYVEYAEINQSENLLFPLLIHAGMWAAAGAAGGLALGLALGGRLWAPGLVGGLAGAVLGACVYEIVGAIGFPTAKTPQPFAEEWLPRVIALFSVCLFAALLSAMFVVDSLRRRAPKA